MSTYYIKLPKTSSGGGGAPTGPAGGSLAGTYPNPTIASDVNLPGGPTTTTQTAGDVSNKIATTSFVSTALGAYVPLTEVGAANGVAPLDSSSKLPVANLPVDTIIYKGTWDPTTNTPTLVNGVGTAGWEYMASVTGTHDFGAGPITFQAGDLVLYDGTIWQQVGGGYVVSVNGQTGVAIIPTIFDSTNVNDFVSNSKGLVTDFPNLPLTFLTLNQFDFTVSGDQTAVLPVGKQIRTSFYATHLYETFTTITNSVYNSGTNITTIVVANAIDSYVYGPTYFNVGIANGTTFKTNSFAVLGSTTYGKYSAAIGFNAKANEERAMTSGTSQTGNSFISSDTISFLGDVVSFFVVGAQYQLTYPNGIDNSFFVTNSVLVGADTEVTFNQDIPAQYYGASNFSFKQVLGVIQTNNGIAIGEGASAGGENSIMIGSAENLVNNSVAIGTSGAKRFYIDSTGLATFTGSILPESPGVTDLGSVGSPWGSVYANAITYTGLTTPMIDMANGIILDTSNLIVIDVNNKTLTSGVGVVSVDFNNFVLNDTTALLSMDWNQRQLYDVTQSLSINYNDRVLADASGSPSVDWVTRRLLNSTSNTSVDWSNNILYSQNGSQLIVFQSDTAATTITQAPGDNSTNLATTEYVDSALVNIANATLSNLSTPTAINQSLLLDADLSYQLGDDINAWSGIYTYSLFYPGSFQSAIDLTGGFIYDAAGVKSLDWFSRNLVDINGVNAIDYNARKLIADNGATSVLNFTSSSGATTITQSAGDNSTKLATTEYVDSAVAAIPAGGITALTGDVTASGSGSVATTLKTVNSNVGTFPKVTVNAKGLVTAATTLVSADIPNNAANTTGTASNITATSNSTLTTLSALSLPATQITGTITATALALSGLTAATGTNSIDSLTNAQTWGWSTATTQNPLNLNATALTTGSLLTLNAGSTANAITSPTGVQLSITSGANGALNLGADAQNRVTTIGSTVGTSSFALRGSSGASTITTVGGSLTVATGAGALNLGTDAAAKVVTVGTVTGAASLLLKAGSGASSLATSNGTFAITTGTGALSIGSDAFSKVITIGNSTASTSVNINAGTGGVSISAGAGQNTYAANIPTGVANNFTNNTTTGTNLSITSAGLTTGSALSVAVNNAAVNSTLGVLNVRNTTALASIINPNAIFASIQPNSTAGSTGITVLNNGNVGIGVTAPIAPLQVNGNIATPYTTTAVPLTLTTVHRNVEVTAVGATITLPAATVTGLEYFIRNATATTPTISAYLNASGVSVTVIPITSTIHLVANGTNWVQF